MSLFQIIRHVYEHRLFRQCGYEPAQHCSPRTGDHFPGGCSIGGPFLFGGRGAYGVRDDAITLVLGDLAALVP
jgi:hypothetical protein